MPAGPRPDPPSRTAKLVHSGHYGDALWSNIMWLFLTGSGEISHDDLVTLATGAHSAFTSTLLGTFNEEGFIDETQVVLYVDGGPFEAIFESSTEGPQSGTPAPANVACCISWAIAAHYRGGHARTYLCCQDVQNTSSPTTWSSSFTGATQTRADDYHEALESLGPIGDGITTVEHGIVSFVHAKAWREPPIFRRISGSSIDTRVDTQRRRLGRDRP